MSRAVEWKQNYWLFLGLLLLVLPVTAFAEKANYFRNQYVCSGELRISTKSKVTCVEKDLSKCKVSQVVIHPTCSVACGSTLKREATNCFMKRSQKWRICKAQTIPDSSQKSGKSCGAVFLTFRSKCGKQLKAKKTLCVQKAKGLLPSCNSLLKKRVAVCKKGRAKVQKSCAAKHKRRLRSCTSGRSRRRDTAGYCRRLFWGCSMKRDRAQYGKWKQMRNDSLAKGLPFKHRAPRCQDRWGCHRGCFLLRQRCTSRNGKSTDSCLSQAHLKNYECSIKGNRSLSDCVFKAENKKFQCMQTISRQRVICLNRVDTKWRSCRFQAVEKKLECWTKEMDQQYKCSGKSYQKCQIKAKSQFVTCQDRCPRCVVTR